MSDPNLLSNPFAALFPTINEAQQFTEKATSQYAVSSEKSSTAGGIISFKLYLWQY